jgi:hypothetical protein
VTFGHGENVNTGENRTGQIRKPGEYRKRKMNDYRTCRCASTRKGFVRGIKWSRFCSRSRGDNGTIEIISNIGSKVHVQSIVVLLVVSFVATLVHVAVIEGYK